MRYFILVLSTFVFALVLSAQEQGKAKGRPPGQSRAGGPVASMPVVFSDTDERIIREWVEAAPPTRLPRGLAKRGELPPGLQKQLRKNGTLPPGLEKRISPFPRELTKRLAPLPAGCGCDRVFLDGRALIVSRATRSILDAVVLF